MTLYEELKWRGLIKDEAGDDIKDIINSCNKTFYWGTDPTADSLHIGHYSSLIMAKRLAKAGHHPIVLVGGATVTKATIPNCFIGVLLLHLMYIVVPRAGQNIFGDGNIGEYFRQFIGYGVIALSLVIHAWRTKRQAEHNREALHTAAEGDAK